MTGGELRALLVLAANTVHPGDGITAIRARVAARRRPWWRRVWARLAAHECDPRGDWIDPDNKRCRICGQPMNETAAPGSDPGTAEPTGWKEPKDMSHDLIEEHTPRGRQMAAALNLAHLLESGPDHLAKWSVDDLGRLHGHVHRPHSDAQAREALVAFAEFFGAKVLRSQGRDGNAEWVHLSVSGGYRGTPVNVWTHVGIRAVSPYASFGGRS